MVLREMANSAQEKRRAQLLPKLKEAPPFGATERITTLERENAGLRDENTQLREENAKLQQQLAAANKNSSTSSKPPSSDMVKPPKPPRKDRKKRKRGGPNSECRALRRLGRRALMDTSIVYSDVQYKSKNTARREDSRGGNDECRSTNVE